MIMVLNTVARHEPITRAQLAARTGLTKSSAARGAAGLVTAGMLARPGALLSAPARA
jgi:DNA-binding IclR family transcriptional regulator